MKYKISLRRYFAGAVVLISMAIVFFLLTWIGGKFQDVLGRTALFRRERSENYISLEKHLNVCHWEPPLAEDTRVHINTTQIDDSILIQELENVILPGGIYRPFECIALDRIALIIPIRDRNDNLRILLRHLLPFLVRQRTNFRVFVVEQTPEHPFNRCLLFNVGYLESSKVDNFTCFILHDTDLIPGDYRNIYQCADKPRHFVISRSNKPFRWLPYPQYIGGVLGVRRSHMEAINGCSNIYYGWGYEDDDLYERFVAQNLTPVRYRRTIGPYIALDHELQEKNMHKRELRVTATSRMAYDGLNSLQYQLVDFQIRKLFTWLLVRVPPPPKLYLPKG